jgi:hypothetical protein
MDGSSAYTHTVSKAITTVCNGIRAHYTKGCRNLNRAQNDTAKAVFGPHSQDSKVTPQQRQFLQVFAAAPQPKPAPSTLVLLAPYDDESDDDEGSSADDTDVEAPLAAPRTFQRSARRAAPRQRPVPVIDLVCAPVFLCCNCSCTHCMPYEHLCMVPSRAAHVKYAARLFTVTPQRATYQPHSTTLALYPCTLLFG